MRVFDPAWECPGQEEDCTRRRPNRAAFLLMPWRLCVEGIMCCMNISPGVGMMPPPEIEEAIASDATVLRHRIFDHQKRSPYRLKDTGSKSRAEGNQGIRQPAERRWRYLEIYTLCTTNRTEYHCASAMQPSLHLLNSSKPRCSTSPASAQPSNT